MAGFEYEIEQQFGVLSEGKGGWQKELNLVSFAGREAKYDIRDWDGEHEKMSKGVTLTRDELIALRDLLNGMDI